MRDGCDSWQHSWLRSTSYVTDNAMATDNTDKQPSAQVEPTSVTITLDL